MAKVKTAAAAPRLPASIEVTAKHALETDGLENLFPQGTRVYLADLGTAAPETLVRAAARLHACGYAPVPHIAARRLASEADLRERLAGFTGEAGVEEVLIIAGSVDRQLGPFDSTMAVLETGLIDGHGVRRLCIAGHPEGSPDIAGPMLMPAMRAKHDFAERTNATVTITTQFSFDIERTLAWARELKGAGFESPVHVGIAGPAKLTTLIKYAAMCGIGASLNFLKKRANVLTALATSYTPDDVVLPLESKVASEPGTLISQIHLYPFGGIRKSAEWLYQHGSWQHDRDRTGGIRAAE